MTFSVDKYLGKVYSKQYTCWDFARDVWLELSPSRFTVGPVDMQQPAKYLHDIANLEASHLTRLEVPVSPCLVLMQRQRINPHVGVYYKGKILHLGPRGASYEALHTATACFPSVRYYT
jgi:hypothetical protein